MKNPEERTFIVYLVTCIVTGKQYVGITAFALAFRWTQHVKTAIRVVRKGALQGAIAKHGAENFRIEIIREVVGLTAACEAEREEIAARATIWPDGYNMNDGGNARAGFTHSEETKRKMRETAVGRVIPESARVKSAATLRRLWKEPEFREAMHKAHTTEEGRPARVASGRRLGLVHGGMMLGKKHTPDALAKMSAASKGRPAWNKGKPMLPHVMESLLASHRGKPGPRTGKKASPETLARMSASKLGFHHTAEAKAKIGAAGRGRRASPETRAKMSAVQMGRVITDEMKARIRATLLGRTLSPEEKKRRALKSAATKAMKRSGAERVRALLEQLDTTYYPRDWEKNLFIGAKQMSIDFPNKETT